MVSGITMERGTTVKIKPPYGKDLAKVEWALAKLTHQTWKMFRTEHGTGEVVEAGVQVLVGHDEWNEIIKTIHTFGGE